MDRPTTTTVADEPCLASTVRSPDPVLATTNTGRLPIAPAIEPTIPRLAVVMIVRDEQEHLPACLDSVAWADERVIVIDAASRDRSEAIARDRAETVVVRPFDDFAAQRNHGLDLANADWILALDADERITHALASEIRRVITEAPTETLGYRIPIRSVILGRRFTHSGTQNDRPIRLFRRGTTRWYGAVHETPDLRDDQLGRLRQPIEHQTLPDLETCLSKLNRYTSLGAENDQRRGHRHRLAIDLMVRPPWTFFKLFILRQGFRDGLEGTMFCLLSSLGVLFQHWKHRERLRRVEEVG